MSWQIDKAHSAIQFSARHMMVSTVRGNFTKFDGEVALHLNNLTDSVVHGTIEVGSINTREEKRDQHLLSADFFDVEKFPMIFYQTTKITEVGERRYRVLGNLTIKDVTRELVLETELSEVGVNPYGVKVMAVEAKGRLNRKDYDLNWNVALESGGFLVGEEIKISLEAEFNELVEGAGLDQAA